MNDEDEPVSNGIIFTSTRAVPARVVEEEEEPQGSAAIGDEQRTERVKQSLSTSRPTGHATHTLTPEPSARSRALYEGPPAVPTLPKAPRQRPTRCPRLCGRRLPDERPPSAQSADLGPPGVVRERRTGRPQAQYAEYDE